ncbi:MAG: UTP--glucose-1-phosphate uridylyltransferase [Flavobacteriaceae bacterium]|nr:UTP--glucose-1-phosphate uridylyltransferase [Flavobacteriaceae bacterium]|tara:strand:- start:365 stop:1249 length:885 start_codon:yes stop_codon:yes gene_type:complete
MSIVKKVLIPVAGLGTRMLPVTKTIPKEMLPVVNKPIIQYIIEEIVDAGFKEIILVTHSSKYSIENHFDKSFELEATLEKRLQRKALKEIIDISKLNIFIQSIRQGEAKGLGHAILCAKRLIGKEPFAIVLPDMLISKKNGNAGDSLKEMRLNFEKEEISSVLLGKVKKADISKYGIAQIKKNSKLPGLGLIKKMIEKPSIKEAPSNLYAAGRYIFNNNFFSYLSKVQPDKSNEFQLTDAIDDYIKDNNKVNAFSLDGKIFDCGDNVEYILANLEFAMRDPLMKTKIKNYLKKS